MARCQAKTRTRTEYYVTVDEKELKLSYGPAHEVEVKKFVDGGYAVGYLVQDEDCHDPISDNDAMGELIDLRESNRGRTDQRRFREVLALDENDERELESEPNPYCVVLDHRGSWSVDSAGNEQDWTSKSCDGIWIATDMDVENIESKIKELCFKPSASIEEIKAEAPLVYQKLAREVTVEYVEGILTEYNAWCEGDCWGVCVDVFDAAGELVEEEACWGFIGSDYANKEVADWLTRCEATPVPKAEVASVPVSVVV